ncbi:MAG: hypothetical protein WD512_04170 [Candidatus Paceibacterota bacterium]
MSSSLMETSLQEVYGDNYVSQFVEDNRRYVADLLVSNIAGMNFREVKHDFSPLFDKQLGEISTTWFQHIKKHIEQMRPSLIIQRITNPNQLPRILNEPQISYFKIFDLQNKNIYIIFITPYILDSL